MSIANTIEDSLKQKINKLKQHLKNALAIKAEICANDCGNDCEICPFHMDVDSYAYSGMDVCDILDVLDTEFVLPKEKGVELFE